MRKILIIFLICLMSSVSFANGIKQALVQSDEKIKYKFKRLTPENYSVKDSYSFAWKGVEYIICTNISDGGLIVFKKIVNNYVFHSKMFQGWTMMWAPCVIEYQDQLIVICSDTDGLEPWWQMQRIKYFSYDPNVKTHGELQSMDLGHDKGVIDPEIIQIGNKYYMFYVIMDWNYTLEGQWEWWDIYYSVADNPLGPYQEEHNISQCVEHGIEEAPFYNLYDNYFYYSVKNSVNDSHIRRGILIMKNGIMDVKPDRNALISATDSLTCTHPDAWNNKIRATLIDQDGQCYIGEK